MAALFALGCVALASAPAQVPVAPPTTPHGEPVSLEMAKKAVAAAETEAAQHGWLMAIAVVDTGSNLVALHRMGNTQIGSIRLAEGKAPASPQCKYFCNNNCRDHYGKMQLP